jgi:methionyl-tRNA formyltransferase
MSGLRVVLAADEAAGSRARALLDRSPLELVAVAVKPGRPIPDVGGAATFDARRLKAPELASELRDLRPDVLLNVHSLYKVHGDVLRIFPIGAWNLHPGPLPEAAGINVPSWAIADRHREHGVTLHEMTETYDGGSIAYEDRFPIAANATGLTLSAECGRRGLCLVRQLIAQLADDPAAVPRLPQDLSKRRFFGLGQPDDGVVDWARTASEIEAYVRAADFRPFESPWSAPVATIGSRTIALEEVAIGEPIDADVRPGEPRCGPTEKPAFAAADRWVEVISWTEVSH